MKALVNILAPRVILWNINEGLHMNIMITAKRERKNKGKCMTTNKNEILFF